MKNISIVFSILLCMCACGTLPSISEYNGRMVYIPTGMKLIEAALETDSSVWLYMESMDSNYIPKVKVLQKVSKYGIVEQKITFKEEK